MWTTRGPAATSATPRAAAEGLPDQRIFKSLLPTYDVFDEDRYFEPARWRCGDRRRGASGVTFARTSGAGDYLPRRLYGFEPVRALMDAGADFVLNLSASPYSTGKLRRREEMLCGLAGQHKIPIAYCNAVGGNDQLIFDGNSIAINENGEILARLAAFREELAVVDFKAPAVESARCRHPARRRRSTVRWCSECATICTSAAFVRRCWGSAGASIARSSPASPPMRSGRKRARRDHADAVFLHRQCRGLAPTGGALGIKFLQIPIKEAFTAVHAQFRDLFAGMAENEAEENMQPRIRGMTLMAISTSWGIYCSPPATRASSRSATARSTATCAAGWR
jgi:hypothetical protein